MLRSLGLALGAIHLISHVGVPNKNLKAFQVSVLTMSSLRFAMPLQSSEEEASSLQLFLATGRLKVVTCKPNAQFLQSCKN